MKLLFAFFTLSLLLLLLFAGSIDGRKELGEYNGKNAMTEQPMPEGRKEVEGYWKKMMKEEPMPEIFQELLANNHQEDANPNAKNDLSQPYGVFAWIKNKPKEGRKEAGGYWKKMMKEEPEIFQELLANIHQEDANPNAKIDLSQPYGVFAWIKNKPKEGRKEAGGYWKKMMKEEPMPEFVDDLSQPYGVFAWIKNKPKEGRKEVGEYWKKVKKEEPMPAEVIRDLVHNLAEAENNVNAKEVKPGFSNGESSTRHCDDEESSPSEANKFGIKDNPIEKVTAN